MFDDDEAPDSHSLEAAAWVSCPYCGEEVELLLDPGGAPVEEFVEDCEVCCRPWSVRVQRDSSGFPVVSVSTLDD